MDSIFKSNWITVKSEEKNKAWKYYKNIAIKDNVKKAVIYSSAIGTYTLKINDSSNLVYHLAPGYTYYEKRVQYQESDVKDLLKKGENTITLTCAPGFLCQINHHEDPPRSKLSTLDPFDTAVICSLHIEYENGDEEDYITDDTWLVCETFLRYSDMYNGEVCDYTFTPKLGEYASILTSDTSTLIKDEGCGISSKEEICVKQVIHTPKGETVFDFGQNLTGHFRVKVRPNKGKTFSFVCGEVLDKDGNFYNGNYREAKATLTITCDDKEHVFESEFVFYGFRYVKVISVATIDKSDVTAVVVHSNIKRIGNIETSNEMLNKLYENIIWGQKGNFVDIPTDCPQRDERLGWTGDAQVFANCACMNFDSYVFFKKWLGDMRLTQRSDGRVPGVVPSNWATASSAWADVCTVLPSVLYMQYDNLEILKENYDMMRLWIDYMDKTFDEYTGKEKFHYGDWLALEKEDRYIGLTPKPFIALVYGCYSANLTIEASKLLGKEYKEIENFKDRCLDKIYKEYSNEEEYAKNNDENDSTLYTQTYYTLRLFFKIYRSEDERKILAKKLIDKVISNGTRLQTGFVGTPYLLFALSDNGYEKTAYSLLMQTKYPSWLYPITKGATTMWEHWDGIKENGEFWSDKMNSFNHYAYGAVGEWMYKRMCGLNAIKPGYKEVLISPITDDRIGYAKGSIMTKYGLISSSWKKMGDSYEYIIVIPSGVKGKACINNIEYALSEGENIIKA